MPNHQSDEQPVPQESSQGSTSGSSESEDTSSPFDHPAFLPVIVTAFALWFGFDGWFNQKTESVLFNRYGFGFLAGAAAYFTLDELTRRPYLLPALWLGYAAWLGAFAWLGGPGDWYYDEAHTQLFNRYGSLVCLGIGACLALAETWRRRRSPVAAPR